MNPEAYDFIIVGAGSSGCVLAERLSADSKNSVLLVEAGGRNETELVNMPRAFMKMFGNPVHFWHFPVNEQRGRPAGEVWPYGRGLGGSSSTNGTWYMRGVPNDYNNWPSPNDEWAWDEILRCFTEMEDYRENGADPRRGRGGPLEITRLPYRSPVISAIVEAGAEMGLEELDDINAPGKVGIGYTQATVNRRGRRASSYQAFLKPALGRKNLAVLTDTMVERVEVEGKRATGIWLRSKEGVRFVAARMEVILSAGAIQSPKLLQLSGIGGAEDLHRAKVELRHELPAVGRNLADHAMFSMAFRLHGDLGFNREFGGWRLLTHVVRYYLTRKGLMAYTSPEVTALISMRSAKDWPDVQFGIGPFSLRSSEEIKADPGRGALESEPGITVNAIALRPKSRGRVRIRTNEPAALPEIEAKWWDNPDDMTFMVEMARLVRKFMGQPALRPFVGQEVTPGSSVESNEALASSLEWLTSPGIHATGTCRIGDAEDSVVDSRLRVHGIGGLRVVDCSVMPAPPAGNTNGPAMAVAWRASELIKADHQGKGAVP